MNLHRQLEATVLAVSLLLATTAGSGMLLQRKGQDFDLVASANPATPHSSDVDRTAMFDRGRGKRTQADAVASSSATCNGCSGTATAVQVISFGKARKGTADNLANAWSTCDNCRTTSVSIQVILIRPGTTVTARNRALAANVGCSGCSTTAVAVQLVVVTTKRDALSRQARKDLEALAAQLESELPGATRTKAARTAAAKNKLGLARIQTLVRQELKPSEIRPSFTLKTG